MGHTCGEPNEIKLTICVLTGFFTALFLCRPEEIGSARWSTAFKPHAPGFQERYLEFCARARGYNADYVIHRHGEGEVYCPMEYFKDWVRDHEKER